MASYRSFVDNRVSRSKGIVLRVFVPPPLRAALRPAYNNTRSRSYDPPMFISRSHSCLVPILLFLLRAPAALAQTVEPLLPAEDGWLPTDTFAWPEELPDPYAPLNAALGGDSVRMVNGSACTGRVEDHYPNGVLKHSGYYGEGRVITYRNFHPNGQVEREFRMKDQTRSCLRTYYNNGVLRSETRYVNGLSRSFVEHYPSGQVRYTEEKHPSLPYYTVMDLFAPDGTPVSTLRVVDQKKGIFEQREYWSNGQLRTVGRSRFNPQRYDSQRIGSWTYHDRQGRPVKEESYVDGKVHETAELR